MNSVFRIYRYAPDYSAFNGRDLTPGDFIEIYPTGIDEQGTIKSVNVYPNPFTNQINLPNATGHEFYMLMNTTGKTVWAGTHIEKQDFTSLSKGVYLLKVKTGDFVQTIKIIK